MATFPLFPANPATGDNFDDYDDEDENDLSDDSDDDLTVPVFDLDDLDDSDDNSDDGSGEGGPPPITANLAQLFALKKGGPPPFPVAGGNVRIPPAPITIPSPVGKPLVAAPIQAPGGLRLAVQPRAPAPAPGLTQTVIQGPVIPRALPTGTIPLVAQPVLKPIGAAPLAPRLGGLTLQPVVQPLAPVLAAQPTAKTVDVEGILSKMSGINVSTITPLVGQIPADINDIIKKENDESPEDFEARRRLTLQLANIPDYKLNNVTAVTAGLMLMKKSKLGLGYDADVEAALSYLTALLQR